MSPQAVFPPERKQYLVTKLVGGTCTEAERDEIIALVLLSLWGKEELQTFIEKILAAKCERCSRGGGFPKQAIWIITVLVLIIATLVGVKLPAF